MANQNDRSARQTLPAINSWPVDADGTPMAIVTGCASDLVPTVPFGNVLIGPVNIMRPVPNGTIEEIIEFTRETQRAAEFVVGSERRIIQWSMDPASKVTPAGSPQATPEPAPAQTAAAPAAPSA